MSTTSPSPPPATRHAPFYVDAPYTPLASIKPDPSAPNQVWYFEGVSNTPASSRASIQIVFMAGAPLGAMPVPLPFLVFVTGTDHDGTYFETALPAVRGAEVMPGKGIWKLPGTAEASWERDRDDESWTVRFGGFAGSEGVLTLKTAVPLNVAHYPTERQDQVLFDHELPEPLLPGGGIGWSTSVPGAEVSFEGTVSGKTVKFTGSGFHDTNFATSQWPNHFAQWFWARGTVGQYTFVIYRFLTANKSTWYTSAAVWKDGKTQTNIWTGSPDWTDDAIEVSQIGPWPDVPQKLEDPVASELGLRVRIGTTTFEVTSTKVVAKGSKLPYGRWIATVKLVGETTLQEAVGGGSFDWFVFH